MADIRHASLYHCNINCLQEVKKNNGSKNTPDSPPTPENNKEESEEVGSKTGNKTGSKIYVLKSYRITPTRARTESVEATGNKNGEGTGNKQAHKKVLKPNHRRKKGVPVMNAQHTFYFQHRNYNMSKSHNKLDNDLKKQSLKGLLSLAGVADNERLSKLVSGQPFRYLLAFFVLKNRVASQATDNNSTTYLPHFTGVNRHIYRQPQHEEVKIYDWDDVAEYKSLLGKYAGRFLTRPRVSPNHPMTFHSVVLTQNLLGGYHA